MPRKRAKSKALAPASFVTPAHGRGKIKQGGNPGNKGGRAYAAALRERARGLIDDLGLIERMGRIANGEEMLVRVIQGDDGTSVALHQPAPFKDQIAATQLLSKIGELLKDKEESTDAAPKVHVYTKQVNVITHVHRQSDAPN